MSFLTKGRAALCASIVALSFVVSHAAAGAEEAPHRAARTLASGSKIEADDTVHVHRSSAPTMLGTTLAYAPAQGHLAVVYLHGQHGKAENGCPHFRAGASELGWLVCPKGIVEGAAGTASWGDDVLAQAKAVDHALRAVETVGASSEPGVAVGFSQGGYVTLDLVRAGRGHFRGLVLIAAPEAHPSATALKAAGVKRVVLGSGRQDAAYKVLEADAKRLASEGMETRFLDLGNVGHTYDAEDPDALRDAIAWAGG